MGRWTDMDSDSERLPSGFERIGYDADSQRYAFRGPDGRTYESEPGTRYGELRPTGQRARSGDAEMDMNNKFAMDGVFVKDGKFVTHNEVVKKDNREAVRMMLPFALLVFLFLILLFKLLYRSGDGADHGNKQVNDCAEGVYQIQVHRGDTCWAIAKKHSLGVDELLKLEGNEKVDCDRLRIGQAICVPT